MKNEAEILKPVHMIAVLSAAIAAIAFVSFCFAGSLGFGAKLIIFSVFAWNLLTAAGIWMKSPWGYYSLKAYLYLLLFVFPVGTLISFNVLKHIKEHSVQGLFSRTSLESLKQLVK